MITAHVVSAGTAAAVVNWTVGVTLVTALVVALLLRRHRVREVPLVVAGVTGVVLLTGLVFPMSPPAPRLHMWIAEPGQGAPVSRPVEMQVCAALGDGSGTSLPGTDRLLAVYVDGSPLTTESAPAFVLPLRPGPHLVRVELVAADHRAFDPDVSTQVHVVAGAIGALPAQRPCS
ncbi:MAG: hypothetical protein E6J03_05115 [Chloroflexi bacterium]|nr:MAG: hypothetical protein E6J03_05115 [Chloroflexota bacterium]